MVKVRGSVCSINRCKRRPAVLGLCKTHAKQDADRLFSLKVREVGYCEINDGKPHNGNLQCAHLFSRSYHAIRWEPLNAMCACAAHHTFYTHHGLEWDALILDRLGIQSYCELRDLALTHKFPDLEMVLAELRANA